MEDKSSFDTFFFNIAVSIHSDTLIGSSAGIIAVGLAEKQGHTITFNHFLKIGFPFMTFTTAIAGLVLAIGILVET